eukprot:21854-Rhodomonas_salina.2
MSSTDTELSSAKSGTDLVHFRRLISSGLYDRRQRTLSDQVFCLRGCYGMPPVLRKRVDGRVRGVDDSVHVRGRVYGRPIPALHIVAQGHWY